MAELPEGTFRITEDTIHALAVSDLTRERLFRLRDILEAAERGDISDSEAEEAVAEEAPEVASLLRRFQPKMGRALIGLLKVVIVLLATQALSEYRDNAATRADVQQAVEQAIQICQQQRPEQGPQVP